MEKGISASRKCRPDRMVQILKDLKISQRQYKEWYGCTIQEWIANNPDWKERQWFELVMENRETIGAL